MQDKHGRGAGLMKEAGSGVWVPEILGKESLSVPQSEIQSPSPGPTLAFPGEVS